jgi:ABC-type sulfate transport system permease component
MMTKKMIRACLVLPFLLPTSSLQVCLIFALFVMWTCVMGSRISALGWRLVLSKQGHGPLPQEEK